MADEELKQIGQYQIRGVLGRGGMATVYRAYQPSLDREVAVKVMSSQFANDPGFLERFRREARAIGGLRHPNILAIYDSGQDGETPYIVTELLEGKTLRERLGQPLDLKVTSQIIQQVASALEYAHEHGIIHRDVKPSNILMGERNRAVLSDFGIVKLLQSSQSLTATGMGVGTPDYMSPEQGSGDPLDGRSDQYSLGIVLYELLTGVTPFRGDTPLAILMGHVSRPLPDPLQFNKNITPQVVEVLKKVLAKKPVDRYKSMIEFAEAFDKAINMPVTSNNLQPFQVSSGTAKPDSLLSPKAPQIYDLVLAQEKQGNYQVAFETLVDLQRQYPNFADVTIKLDRYKQMKYQYTGTNTLLRPDILPSINTGPSSQTGTGEPSTFIPQNSISSSNSDATQISQKPIGQDTAATEIGNNYPSQLGKISGQAPYTPIMPSFGASDTGYRAVQAPSVKTGNNKLLLEALGVVGLLVVGAVVTIILLFINSNKPNPTQVSVNTPLVPTSVIPVSTSPKTSSAGTTAVTTASLTTQKPSTTSFTTTGVPVKTTPAIIDASDPANSQVSAVTTKLYQSKADFKTTVGSLKSLVKQFPNSWVAQRELGITLFLWNIESGEVEALQKAVELNPNDPKSHAFLSMVYHDGYANEKALAEAMRAIELDPNDPDSHAAYSMALTLADTKNTRIYEEASKALELDNNGLWPRWSAFLAEDLSENYDAALEHIDFLISKYPNMATFYSAKGNLFNDQYENDSAIIWFKNALKIEPNYSYAHSGLGWIYYEQDLFTDAESEFRAAVDYNDSHDSGHIGLGYVLNYKGKFDEAIEHLKRATQINSESPDAFNGLAFNYYDKGEIATNDAQRNQYFTLALDNAENALKYLPNYTDATFNKGRALYGLARYSQAEPFLQKVVDKQPQSTLYLLYLGYNHFAQKKYDQARAEAQEILKIQPSHERALKLLDDIKKITGS